MNVLAHDDLWTEVWSPVVTLKEKWECGLGASLKLGELCLNGVFLWGFDYDDLIAIVYTSLGGIFFFSLPV